MITLGIDICASGVKIAPLGSVAPETQRRSGRQEPLEALVDTYF